MTSISDAAEQAWREHDEQAEADAAAIAAAERAVERGDQEPGTLDLQAQAREQASWDALAPYRDETGWLNLDQLDDDVDELHRQRRPTVAEVEIAAQASIARSRMRRCQPPAESEAQAEARRMALTLAAFVAALAAIMAIAYLAGA